MPAHLLANDYLGTYIHSGQALTILGTGAVYAVLLRYLGVFSILCIVPNTLSLDYRPGLCADEKELCNLAWALGGGFWLLHACGYTSHTIALLCSAFLGCMNLQIVEYCAARCGVRESWLLEYMPWITTLILTPLLTLSMMHSLATGLQGAHTHS